MNAANKLLIVGSSLLGVIAIATLDYTINKITFLSKDKNEIVASDSNGFYQPKPNLKTTSAYGSLTYDVYTDKNGYRISSQSDSRIISSSTCPTVYFIGDSFTWGSGLSFDDSYPGQFAKSYSGQVDNLGVESHSPTAYLARIQRVIQQEMDNSSKFIVVAGIDISDVQDESSIWTDSPTSSPLLIKQSEARPSIKEWLATRLPLSYKAYSQLKKIVMRTVGLEDQSDDSLSKVANIERSAFTHTDWDSLEKAYAPRGVQGGLQRLQNKVVEISESVENGGGSLFLLEYPWPAQIAHQQKYLNWPQYIKGLCDISHCSGVIETTSHFSTRSKVDSRWYENYYIKGDVHFNSNGYQVLSKAIKDKLFSSASKKCFRS